MRKLTILLAIVLTIIITGCNTQSSAKDVEAKIDTEALIANTEKIIATAEEVYRNGREYTTEEEVDIEYYEEQYGEIEDTDIKLTVNSALLVAHGAKKLDGVEDTFDKDLSYVRQLIEDIK